MSTLRKLGSPPAPAIAAIRQDSLRSGCLYAAVMDNAALYDPQTLDTIAREFPSGLLPLEDVYLLLVECIANAVCHSNAEALGLCARRRGNVLLINFLQIPSLPPPAKAALARGRTGWLPDYNNDATGGLGFPILLRLCHGITLAHDQSRLRLWFRIGTKNTR